MADKNDLSGAKKPKKNKPEKRKFRRIKETWSELKKVTWPTAGTIIKSTGVVLLVVAMFLVVLLVFDIILRIFAFNPLTDNWGDSPLGSTSDSFAMLSGYVKSMGGTVKNVFTSAFGRALWL